MRAQAREGIFRGSITVSTICFEQEFRRSSMIIDVRTRIGAFSDPQDPSLESASAAHRAAMACVDASIIAGFRSDRLGLHDPIETIAALVHECPTRRLGFAGIDPLTDGALEDIDRAHELGLAGVSISPADQGCRATHDRCLDALARCAEHGMPVLIANPCLNHSGSRLEFARPETLDDAAGSIDGLTMLLGDIGAGWLDEAFTLAAKHPRVYVEISGVVSRPWALYNTLITANERGVIQKLLFGSNYPAECPNRAIERIYTINSQRAGSAMPMIPREFLRQIIERDALACLGLDHLLQAAHNSTSDDAPKRAPSEVNGVAVGAGAAERVAAENGRV